MRVIGANDAHVQLMRERYVAGKAAVAADQRRVLEARDRLADPFRPFLAHSLSIRRFPREAD